MTVPKMWAGEISDYPLVRRLVLEFNWELELSFSILAVIMPDYKTVIDIGIPDDFNDHVETVLVDLVGEHGHIVDEYHLLYEMAETVLHICSKYHNVGIFKDMDIEMYHSAEIFSRQNKIILTEYL